MALESGCSNERTSSLFFACERCRCACIVALTACGPDDAATVGNSPPTAPQAGRGAPSALNASVSTPLPSGIAGSTANAFNTPPANSMSAARNAQDSGQDGAAILSAQASLAADNQQVTPVLRYAPGDDSH
nr:hypothetical protein [uncultured bacterium]